jgi:palmitoyltransferase
MSGNTRLVKKLLVAGADRTVHGKENKTPADMAQEHEYHNIHSMLTKQDNALIRYYNIKQGFKRKRKSPRELVRFALIFMYQCGTFGVFVVDIDTVLHNYFLISVLSMIVLVLILFIVLVCMDPGSMKQGRHSLLKLLKTEECYNVCATCATIKLPRSKHCDVCQRCVMVYDHHCPWINNCIGARNHAVFVLFVFMLIVCMSTTTYLVVDVLLTDEYQPPYI